MQWFGFCGPAIRPTFQRPHTHPRRYASQATRAGVLLLAAFVWPTSSVRADPPARPTRLALVIGNADYPAAPLSTGANDAGLVAETLAQTGFDVTAMANVDGKTLARLLQAFETKARGAAPDAMIVVYLAGYGVQYDGETFFVPLDAQIARGSDVPVAATRLSVFIKAIEAVPAKAHVFIEDLAQVSPFAMKDAMPLAPGLAPAQAPTGSLYAANAAPGAVAPPQLPPYGAYARALSEMIQDQTLALPELFRRVRLRAGEYTNGAVVPWDDARFDAPVSWSGQVTALPAPSAASPLASLSPGQAYSEVVARDTLAGYAEFVGAFPNDPLLARVKLILAVRREAAFWTAASEANTAVAFWTYMRRYPRLAHYWDARRKLAALGAPLEPPPRFDITMFADLPAPSADEVALLDRPAMIVADPDWAPIPSPPAALLPPARAVFTDELPPPPLLPATVLPIPVPVASPHVLPVVPGRIAQPFVPSLDEVTAQTSGATPGMTTVTLEAGAKGLIARLAKTTDKGENATITQTGPKDVVVSRTTIIHDSKGATIVQTGPNGGVMTKAVTWTASDGARSTVIRNGGNQIIADIKRNEQGIVVSEAAAGTPPPPSRQAPVVQAPSASLAPQAKTGAVTLKVPTPSPSSTSTPSATPGPRPASSSTPGAAPAVPQMPIIAKPMAPTQSVPPAATLPASPPVVGPKAPTVPPAPVSAPATGAPTRPQPTIVAPEARQPETRQQEARPPVLPQGVAPDRAAGQATPGARISVPLPIPRPHRSGDAPKAAPTLKPATRHGHREPSRRR